MHNEKKYYIASCSCGKDSIAMVLRLIEENKPLDEIVFYDTGMEFQAIYDNWERLRNYVELKGIQCTRLQPNCPFLYTMFEKPVNVGKPNEHKGYSWCGGCCRWGTTAKLQALDRHCQAKKAICYVGIAADETERLIKERKPYKLFPLADWGMTESDCLTYCRDRGVKWQEQKIDLYDILDRVSCWCCANKNQWELYNIWRYLPTYWERLKDLQSKTDRPFKKEYSVFNLETRFENGFVPKHRKKVVQVMSQNVLLTKVSVNKDGLGMAHCIDELNKISEMEFQAIYDNWKRLRKYIELKDIR